MHLGFLDSKPQEDFISKKIEEHTQTIDLRWKISRCDISDSLSAAESHLNELLLSLSSQGKGGKSIIQIYRKIEIV